MDMKTSKIFTEREILGIEAGLFGKTFPDHWEHHATFKLLFTRRRRKKMF